MNTLSACRENDKTIGEDLHEINGRLAFHMNRFETMIDWFEKMDILAPEGAGWFVVFKKKYISLLETTKSLITQYSFEKQVYDFDFEIFKEVNESLYLEDRNM